MAAVLPPGGGDRPPPGGGGHEPPWRPDGHAPVFVEEEEDEEDEEAWEEPWQFGTSLRKCYRCDKMSYSGSGVCINTGCALLLIQTGSHRSKHMYMHACMYVCMYVCMY